MKRALCIVLSLLLLSAIIPLASYAGNGPFDGGNIGWWGSGCFTKIDEHGFPVENGDGIPVATYFWTRGEAGENFPGTVYDRETNTLTLNSIDAPDYNIDLMMMGEDFKIVVNGVCRIGAILSWGNSYGSNVDIEGTGTLIVNDEMRNDQAFYFVPETIENFSFKIGSNVTVKMYAPEGETVVRVLVFDEPDNTNFFDFANSPEYKTKCYHPIVNTELSFPAFFSDGSSSSSGWKVVRDDDPDGLFGGFFWEWQNDQGEIVDKYYEVQHFVYSSTLKTYFKDYEYWRDHGGSEGTVRFDTQEEMEAAGYKSVYSEGTGVLVQNTFSCPWAYSSSQLVMSNGDGKYYTVSSRWNNETQTSYNVVYEMLEIPEYPTRAYYCVPVNGISENSLKSVYGDVIANYYYLDLDSENLVFGDNSNPFIDVPSGKWFTKAVLYCYENGYMNGVSSDRFDPNGTLTRAMFVQILAKIANADLSGYDKTVDALPFKDVKAGKWYVKALKWAFENGYTSGVSAERFGTNDPVTRQQLASFLCTFSKKNGIDVSAAADITGYEDYAKVSKWARAPLAWAVGSGLISGTTKTTLSPQNSATRAQVALIIMNYVEKIFVK
ncbi:MAG: S-layer homology domain-containing protein [Clostridia bacterium]|nr:S-layer homology domain-containing protein [Clostridia bacterium]